MKNVLIIWSSPNTDGLTSSAARSVEAGIVKNGGSCQLVQLNALKLNYCRACGRGYGMCMTDGHCFMDDDFEDLYKKAVEADGIVFVTAVYWHDVTEVMKVFLDRLRRCENASGNRLLSGKHVVTVACAGGTGNGAIDCLLKLDETMGHLGIKPWDRLPVIRFNKDYMVPALEQCGGAFVKALEDGFK